MPLIFIRFYALRYIVVIESAKAQACVFSCRGDLLVLSGLSASLKEQRVNRRPMCVGKKVDVVHSMS